MNMTQFKKLWNRPLSGTIVIARTMIVASPFFIIPGGIGMYTYKDAPHTDICDDSGAEWVSGSIHLCSTLEDNAATTFCIGLGLIFSGFCIELMAIHFRKKAIL
jgi:hypothetical protein